MKPELLAFGLGWLFKSLFAATVGEALVKPFVKWGLDEIRRLPRVIHYYEQHPGKSWFCDTCRLGHPKHEVDSIS